MVSLTSYAYNADSYIFQRFPNPTELIYRGLPKVIIEKGLEAYGYDFGYNPATSHGLREVVVLGVNGAILYSGAKVYIGNGKNYYDEGTFYSTALSVGCKAVVIAGAAYVYPEILANKASFQTTVISANFICETPARYLAIASRERQDANKTDIDFFSYLHADGGSSWGIEALASGIPRMLVSTFVAGKVAEWSGIGQSINGNAIRAEHNLVRQASGDHLNELFNKDGNIYNRIQDTGKAVDGALFKTLTCSGVFALDVTGKFAAEFSTAYIQVPLTKLTQDIFGGISRLACDYFAPEKNEEAVVEAVALNETMIPVGVVVDTSSDEF